jgi:hypothetical protein
MRALLPLVGIAGCGDLYAARDTADAATDAATTSDGGADSPDGGVEAGCAQPSTRSFEPVADTSPGSLECTGSISRGGDAFAALGPGVLLLRFVLDSDTASAIRGGRAASMVLDLADNSTCEGTGCDLPATGGALSVHVLRNDWDEGSNTPYSGADMCRRTSGVPGSGWGATDAP